MSTISSSQSALGDLVAWNQPSISLASATRTPQTQSGATPTLPNALDDLISFNEVSEPAAATTTVQQAQQTVAQSPATILSPLVAANTSIYGAAPAVDSLLGNISTSGGLSVLAQINASRIASTQIDPFPTTDDAISYATESEAESQSDIVSSALGSVGVSSAVLAAYYPASAADTSEPQLEVTG